MSATPEARAQLTDPFAIGGVQIENRILLAPLAGIGNWFVRIQARRHGAGMAVSEMVSSYAIRHGNRRTLEEMLRIHPDEHPVSVQLFGPDPDVMRGAAATVAEAGADIVDLNMGCPVPKVCKTGAGAALIADPTRAVAVARAAREGSGLPVTVKVRSGLKPGDRSGFELAERLAGEAGVAAIAFHPRAASVHHQGMPDYDLVRELRGRVDVPVIVSGGLRSAELARRAYELSGADAVMVARGSLGNPWIFEELTGSRDASPTPAEIADELRWVLAAAEEHWGPQRAARNLRKFYPWYVERLGITGPGADAFQRTESLDEVRTLLAETVEIPAPDAFLARETATL
jgi:tRNA-dihydrouridine synthase B